MTVHSDAADLRWRGATGDGDRAYRRDHTASAAPAADRLSLSADPAFRGDPALLNPEQLLLMAASSCQLLSFLALAARHRVDVRDYHDAATATMDDRAQPVRIGDIVLSPTVTVAAGTDPEQVKSLAAQAHRECYVANSLNSTITVRVTVIEDRPGP